MRHLQDLSFYMKDEKGPIAAKTYGGTSWCATQVKIDRTSSKDERTAKCVWCL